MKHRRVVVGQILIRELNDTDALAHSADEREKRDRLRRRGVRDDRDQRFHVSKAGERPVPRVEPTTVLKRRKGANLLTTSERLLAVLREVDTKARGALDL